MEFIYFILCARLRKIPSNDAPDFNAMIILGTIHGINLITLSLLVEPLVGVSFHSRGSVRLAGIFLGLVVYAIDYFWFYRRKEQIRARFEKGYPAVPLRYLAYPVAYFVASFGAVIAVSTYIQ